jgi:putative ABC transport system substrate-binding protein
MKRRTFIAGLAGAAAWPLVARAQQGERVRRIGVLMAGDENDPGAKTYVSAFTQALAGLGWTDGRNVRIDLRWGRADTPVRVLLPDLVGSQPDIIVTSTTPATAAAQRGTRTIPIVFAGVGDPVASGIVPRLDRPGGNVTGFAALEPSLAGKWLELLSEIAPGSSCNTATLRSREFSQSSVRVFAWDCNRLEFAEQRRTKLSFL